MDNWVVKEKFSLLQLFTVDIIMNGIFFFVDCFFFFSTFLEKSLQIIAGTFFHSFLHDFL